MNFAGYTGSKSPVQNRLKIQFGKLDFSKLIFQKSSTDQQGVRSHPQKKCAKSLTLTFPSKFKRLGIVISNFFYDGTKMKLTVKILPPLKEDKKES